LPSFFYRYILIIAISSRIAYSRLSRYPSLYRMLYARLLIVKIVRAVALRVTLRFVLAVYTHNIIVYIIVPNYAYAIV